MYTGGAEGGACLAIRVTDALRQGLTGKAVTSVSKAGEAPAAHLGCGSIPAFLGFLRKPGSEAEKEEGKAEDKCACQPGSESRVSISRISTAKLRPLHVVGMFLLGEVRECVTLSL